MLPVNSADPLAPMSKYKVGSAVDYDEDDLFRTSALLRAPKETGADRNSDSDSGTDVEMPGISKILAQETCESQRMQKECLQQLKLAAIDQRQQKRASTSAGSPPGAEQDLGDDGFDVVPMRGWNRR